MFTIAVTNQKGGVGKTTTSINLAAYLVGLGKKVLLIDLDPQGNATSGLGVQLNPNDKTTKDLLLDDSLSADVIKISGAGVAVVPTNSSLASAEILLVDKIGREYSLKNAIDRIGSSKMYDIVLIDCPPSLGLLTVNSLVAANFVLIPVQTEYFALEGLGSLVQIISEIKKALNPNLSLIGIVMTMYDARNGLSSQVVEEVKKHFGSLVMDSLIPRNIRLAEAPSFGKTIEEHDKWSKGAKAYQNMAKELVERLKEFDK